jgi:hypothetical protein
MKLVITIDPVTDIGETTRILQQIALHLPEQIRRLQFKVNIVSTFDHAEQLGTVEFFAEEES